MHIFLCIKFYLKGAQDCLISHYIFKISPCTSVGNFVCLCTRDNQKVTGTKNANAVDSCPTGSHPRTPLATGLVEIRVWKVSFWLSCWGMLCGTHQVCTLLAGCSRYNFYRISQLLYGVSVEWLRDSAALNSNNSGYQCNAYHQFATIK